MKKARQKLSEALRNRHEKRRLRSERNKQQTRASRTAPMVNHQSYRITTFDEFSKLINSMTNKQRNQYAKKGSPGLQHKDVAVLRDFMKQSGMYA